MGSCRRAVIQTNSDGRSPRLAVAGRIWQTRTHADTDMAADPLTTGGILGRGARLMPCASLIPASDCLIAGLKFVGPRGFAQAKAYGGGATTNRNDYFSQIHLKPKRFMQRP